MRLDSVRYDRAIRLVRGSAPVLREDVEAALGEAAPDGSEGNVWAIHERRMRAFGSWEAYDRAALAVREARESARRGPPGIGG